MIGTRGVPAAYGGFETAIEEIGSRLAAQGHEITVYCRSTRGGERPKTHLGMELVHLPALRSKSLETLSHTSLSVAHLLLHRRKDAAFVFNAANSPLIPFILAPTAVHVDGLEWKRGKWGKWGRRYYRIAEQLAVRWSDALISDAQGIADYYTSKFGITTELLTYGTRILSDPASDRLADLGLEAGRFHLVVARFEPENHVDVIVDGYTASAVKYPLVVVGSAPYSAAYTKHIADTAAADDRIRILGGVWDQELLDQLYANAFTYLHGHSVGGTNPSLLRAMGAGTAVLAWDVNFNREVLGPAPTFRDPSSVKLLIEQAESDPDSTAAAGAAHQARAATTYKWDEVSLGYEALAYKLARGHSTKGITSGSRGGSRNQPKTTARSVNA